jgi:hypothetical protein
MARQVNYRRIYFSSAASSHCYSSSSNGGRRCQLGKVAIIVILDPTMAVVAYINDIAILR